MLKGKYNSEGEVEETEKLDDNGPEEDLDWGRGPRVGRGVSRW